MAPLEPPAHRALSGSQEPFVHLCQSLFGTDIQSLKFILVELDQQRLLLISGGVVLASYKVSTALNGAGNRNDTGCTPIGWHTVSEKIGQGATIGTVFKGRVPEQVLTEFCSDIDNDSITSRILWLAGAQPGFNSQGSVDSKRRYIYIHGTAQEHLLGQAVSHGCIRMSNSEVIELFEQVEVGTPVLVTFS